MGSTRRIRRGYLLLLGALALVGGIEWSSTAWAGQLHADDARAWIQGFGALAPVAYVATLALSILVPPFPNVVLVMAAGLAFGAGPATAYTMLGGTLGAGLCFGLSQRLGRPRLERWLGASRFKRVDALAGRIGWPAVFLARLLPGFNFDLISYAAGLTAISVPAFLTATLAGMFVPVVVLVRIGEGASERPELALIALGISAATWTIGPALVWRVRRAWSSGRPRNR